MNNYILIIGLILTIAGIGYGVMKLWRKEKQALAVLFLCLGLVLVSGASWAALNRSAESRPPAPDLTAVASEAYIDNLERERGDVTSPTEERDYSEQNESENREAVERFKALKPAN